MSTTELRNVSFENKKIIDEMTEEEIVKERVEGIVEAAMEGIVEAIVEEK